jgi:hypothetical protein
VKRCSVCANEKPIEEFGKSGRNAYRAACKVCYNFKRRNQYDIAKRVQRNVPGRKPPEYHDIPLPIRKTTYHNAIDRMVQFGIMSDTYAETAREKVDAL